MFGGIVLASEATVSDFQAAVQEADADHGCTSIPYEDLRDKCKDNQEHVVDYCKGGHGPWSCQDKPNLDPTSLIAKAKGLKAHIEELKQKKEDLEKQKDDLSDKLDDATDENEKSELEAKIQKVEEQIAATEDDIEKKGEILDGMKEKLGKDKDETERRGEIGKQCVEHRTDVQEQFDEATSSAGDESDEQIKPLAEKLIDYWGSKKAGHQKAVDDVNAGVEKCSSFHDQIGDALSDL